MKKPFTALINANSNPEQERGGIPLKDESVQLIFTSPPYFNLRDYGGGEHEVGQENTVGDYIGALVNVFNECWRVLRPDGVLYVNLGDSYYNHRPGYEGMREQTNKRRGKYAAGGLVPNDVAKRTKKMEEFGEGDMMNIPHNFGEAMRSAGWTWRSAIIWNKAELVNEVDEVPLFDLPVEVFEHEGTSMPESINGWRWERHRIPNMTPERLEYEAALKAHQEKTSKGRSAAAADLKMRRPPPSWTDCPGCDRCRKHAGLVLNKGSWRPTRAYELILMFTKGGEYFADREAAGVPYKEESKRRAMRAHSSGNKYANGDSSKAVSNSAPRDYEGYADMEGKIARGETTLHPSGSANPRDIMRFAATNYKGNHYAAFPTTMPEYFIRIHTPDAGSCSVCGAPYARVVSLDERYLAGGSPGVPFKDRGKMADRQGTSQSDREGITQARRVTLGWLPTCEHLDAEPVPAVVLDPFGGTGSTAIAARKLGRSSIILDLSLGYLRDEAQERLGITPQLRWTAGRGNKPVRELKPLEELPMFAVPEDAGE